MATTPKTTTKHKYTLGWDVRLEIGGRPNGSIGKVVGHITWINGVKSYIVSIVDRNTGAPAQWQVEEHEIHSRYVAPLPPADPIPADPIPASPMPDMRAPSGASS